MVQHYYQIILDIFNPPDFSLLFFYLLLFSFLLLSPSIIIFYSSSKFIQSFFHSVDYYERLISVYTCISSFNSYSCSTVYCFIYFLILNHLSFIYSLKHSFKSFIHLDYHWIKAWLFSGGTSADNWKRQGFKWRENLLAMSLSRSVLFECHLFIHSFIHSFIHRLIHMSITSPYS